MRYVQTEITEEDFLRLKALSVISRKRLKTILREAILLYLNSTKLFNQEGEV